MMADGTDTAAACRRDEKELLDLVRSLKARLVECSGSFDPAGFSLSGSESVSPAIRSGEGEPESSSIEESLDDVRHALGECERCGLCETRRQIVFGEGNPRADLVFVGEAPGEEEDRQGRPFVGRAGQLLTKIIEAMDMKREEVYICNILKCRPPGNRNPRPDEIGACEPFLTAQIRAIQPKVICALGTFAARTLLSKEVPITVMRGAFHSYQGVPLMPTYHPAYLLRNPGAKRQVWEDMQMIMELVKKPAEPEMERGY